MILVKTENVNFIYVFKKLKHMWQVNTKYYPETETSGAKYFLEFIEKELIPYIETNYQTTQKRSI